MNTAIEKQAVIDGMESYRKPDQMELLIRASASADPETLAKLLDLQLRWEANEARKAYLAAMHQFRQNMPTILKTRKVKFNQTEYSHAELDKVCDALIPELGKYGLSAGWNSEPAENGKIRVSCIITYTNRETGLAHRQVESTLDGPPDTSGSKNNVQAIGSTSSYLNRYTLLNSLGIVAKGQDNDGKTSEGIPDQTVQDYLAAIEGAHEPVELQGVFKEAWTKAKACGDTASQNIFQQAYDKRKRFFASQTRGAK